MLELNDNEKILFYTKISNQPFFFNYERDARLLWLVTQEKLIFMDYYRVPVLPANVHSWRKKDIILLKDILGITAGKKKFTLAPQSLITIQTTNNDIYEVVFYTEKKCINSFNELNIIVKELNPKTEFRNELSERS
jgi:hypothetical protein